MDIELFAQADQDLGELHVIEMDELKVSGASSAYAYIAKNVDRSADSAPAV